MEKMTLQEFQNTLDGCINDFVGGVSDGIEFRTAVMEVMIEAMKKCLEIPEKSCEGCHC